MDHRTSPEALEIALQYHQAGRLTEAEQIYRKILAVQPDHPGALHLLGLVAHQAGQHQIAIDYISQAIRLKGTEAAFHNNLGEAYRAQGKTTQAIDCYRQALELQPEYAKAYNNLGNAFQQQGNLKEAVAFYRKALELQPDYVKAHNNLGVALNEQRNLDDAVPCFRRALELKPDYAEAYYNLGNAFQWQGNLTESADCYRRALELKPDYIEAHNNLGNAYQWRGNLDDAVACFCRALELNPNDEVVHNNLGNVFLRQGNLKEAAACYRKALELMPGNVVACNNLGNAFRGQGNLKESLTCYYGALKLQPGFAEAHSNLLLSFLYHSDVSAKELRESQAEFNQRFAIPLQHFIRPHSNDRTPTRRLRIGYVSPDFRDHAVGWNVWPLFREHDHERFEIFAYANSFQQDDLTARFQSVVDAWREVAALSDEALAQQIRDDQIDILVDLALHTANNRLLVLARKPAPVQVTFAGYPGTTGLSAIDYRLTDPYLDPPSLFDDCYSEESIRLPASWWCYDPLNEEPAVHSLPAKESGIVTFGCLNNFCKVNEPTLKLWARVLRELPLSRLLLLAPEGTAREQALTMLAQEGISVERASFVTKQPRLQYLGLYNQIDISLDTLPYNGHTTSLDSLWMGVPVVTLVGQTVVGRAGFSQLMNLGLPELIAHTPEQFVKIATELASDLPRLARLRQGLRQRTQDSPLMDTKGFAQGIENAYRTMWQRWCAE